MRPNTILIVEDDTTTSQLISQALRQEGFSVSVLENGNDVIPFLHHHAVDLVILAVLLRDINGIDLCLQIRQFSYVPIIFVSKKSADVDVILGLDVGGDDYIVKPFHVGQLVARVKAHLRRASQYMLQKTGGTEQLKYKGLEIDIATHTIMVEGKEVALSPKEFDLLVVLARNPHRVFYIDELYKRIWGSDSLGDARTIIVHISNLRRKIQPNETSPKYIITVRGKGYKFNATFRLQKK